MKPKTEAEIQAEILEAFGASPSLRLWRNNVGVARTLDGQRMRRFGVPGSADILGILKPKGRMVAIEVKGPRGRLSDKQGLWQQMFEDHGGLYIVARSVEDVTVGLRDAGITVESTP